MQATSQDDDSVVGDECHIIARHSNGPRSNASLTVEELDSYNNLILLCKVHHKMVDDQPNTYAIDVLREMKQKHEKWIQETLQQANAKKKNPGNQIAIRIMTGKDALSIVTGYNGPQILDSKMGQIKIQ